MREDLTQAELDQIFYGKPPPVKVKFYLHTVTDVGASREAGHRIETQRPYVHLKCDKEGTEIHRPVQELDKKRYSREWLAFEQEQVNELSGQVPDLRAETPGLQAAGGKKAGNW